MRWTETVRTVKVDETVLGAYLLGIILGVGVGMVMYGASINDLLQFLILLAVGLFLGIYSILGFWAIVTGRWVVENENEEEAE